MSDDRLERYSASIAADGLVPLWDRFKELVSPAPAGQAAAHVWRYERMREALLHAGEIISVEQAERRVLILENPALPGSSSITRSLYAGLQLLRPGEVAPAHRHTQSALRIILEGESAHSTVEGDKTPMSFGDVVVTPPWAWHDHGNDSATAEDTVWLDALDIPTVSFYDASFMENHPAASQRPRPNGRAGLWGAGLRPADRPTRANPLTSYPYAEALKRLEHFAAQTEPHPVRGWEAEYIDPATGGPILTTMSAFLGILPEGPSTGRYRSTDATVLVPLEGSGTTTIGRRRIRWKPRDVLVIPSWAPYSHSVDGGSAVVFSYSDRAAQIALGLWREESDRTPQSDPGA
jgi:gentisate 1,2-dioxygenase